MLVHINYGQMPLINIYADISSKASSLNFGLSHHLHLYYVHVSSEGSGKFAHMQCIVN